MCRDLDRPICSPYVRSATCRDVRLLGACVHVGVSVVSCAPAAVFAAVVFAQRIVAVQALIDG